MQKMSFLIRTVTVGSGIHAVKDMSPDQPPKRVMDYTIGRDLHPALKIFIDLSMAYYNTIILCCKELFLRSCYPNILQPQIKLFLHQELKDLCTTLPLLEDASITVPPPATMPTWPLTTIMAPARRSEKLLMRV